MNVVTIPRVASALVAGLLWVAGASDSRAAYGGWEHTLAIYMVGASIDGTAGVGPLEADVDASFSDILDNLDWGAMGAYRGERGPWSVALDVMYLAVEADASGTGPNAGTRAEAAGDQLIMELDGGYALADGLDAYLGMRYWQVDADVTIRGGGPLGVDLRGSKSESWVDPVIGLRYQAPLGQRWRFVVKGDVGGFGVGSDFTWQATAFAAWHASEHTHVLIGYRHIDVDYDDGAGVDRFLWDLAQGGPTVGIARRF